MKRRRYPSVSFHFHSPSFLTVLSIFCLLFATSSSTTTLQNELRRRQSHQVEDDPPASYHTEHQSTPSHTHKKYIDPEPYSEQDEHTSAAPHEEEEELPMERLKRAFGRNDYLLPENFKTLRRADIPVTYRLHDDLLRYYRKGTRPVTHPKKVISVSMSVFLYQIVKLDAVKNTISLSGSFELYWEDEFLKWNPSSYEGAEEIFLSSSDIWIPEFSLYYSLNFNDAVKLQSNNDVRVNYTGQVRYYIPFSSESLCKLDVKFFPFDVQQCSLLFGSWAHSNDSIKYSLYSQNLSLIDFYDNQEWELDTHNSSVHSDGFLYDYLDPPLFWEMIIITLVMKRQSFYYVFNLVIPSTMITLVSVIGFHTPSTSGRMRDAKFRLGIMTLMSMSVILLAIVEDMPKFSMGTNRRGRGSFSGIPLIGLYYFILLAIIGMSTVTTSMFVYLERESRVKMNVPWYLKWLSFDISPSKIARKLSRYRPQAMSQPPSDNPTPARESIRRRLSMSQYDNMLIYQYYEQALEDIANGVSRMAGSIAEIRSEMMAFLPQDDINTKWQTVIRRLEILSLFFYVSVLFTTMYLFFYHDWYCAIGHNPCGQANLKCPWMAHTPEDPHCEHNSYN